MQFGGGRTRVRPSATTAQDGAARDALSLSLFFPLPPFFSPERVIPVGPQRQHRLGASLIFVSLATSCSWRVAGEKGIVRRGCITERDRRKALSASRNEIRLMGPRVDARSKTIFAVSFAKRPCCIHECIGMYRFKLTRQSFSRLVGFQSLCNESKTLCYIPLLYPSCYIVTSFNNNVVY